MSPFIGRLPIVPSIPNAGFKWCIALGPKIGGGPISRAPRIGKEGGHNRGLGVKPVWELGPKPLTNFYDFHLKSTDFNTLFY